LAQSNKTDQAGRLAENFSNLNALTQIINGSTRIPDRIGDFANTLDLFLTSNSLTFSSNIFPPIGNSDHNLIVVYCNSGGDICRKSIKRKIFHFKRADWDGLSAFFHDMKIDDSLDPSIVAINLSNTIKEGIEKFIPSSVFSKSAKSPPWFNPACHAAHINKQKNYKKWKRDSSENNRHIYVTSRNLCNRTIRESKRKFIDSCHHKLLEHTSSSRAFWKLAKHFLNNHCSSSFPPLTDLNGVKVSDAAEKANMFASVFSLNSNQPHTDMLPPKFDKPPIEFPIFEITEGEVLDTLLHLDISKSSGPDNIPPVVLSKCTHELSLPLCRLFNLSLSSQVFPSSWKHARIQPVFKKGDSSQPCNYRPISITSILSKAFENIVNRRLLGYLEENLLLNDHQYAFRHNRSTGDLLSKLI
jgi:hypothetical protein